MARTPMALEDTIVGTRSCSTIETANGFHHFTIYGYSFSKGMGVGKYIASEKFTAGGYQWVIYFYPDGYSTEENSLGYVSVYIALVSEATDVRAVYELILLDQSSKAEHNVHSRFDGSLEIGIHTQYRGKTRGHKHFYRRAALETSDVPMYEPSTFKHGKAMDGFKRFCLRAELETSNYLKNDNISMICILGVVGSPTQGPKLCSIPFPKTDLGHHFGALLYNGEDDLLYNGEDDVTFGGDVIFEVDGEIFQAHKLVLAARSPVFKAQFYGPILDENKGKIHIEDMEALVFKCMLHFIYKDELPDTDKVIGSTSLSSTLLAQQLLVAADCYALHRLKLLCESKLCEDVNTDTVATILAFAEQYDASQLKAFCLKYATVNFATMMQSDDFKYLKDSCPSFQSKLLSAVAGAGVDEKIDIDKVDIDKKVESRSRSKKGFSGGNDASGRTRPPLDSLVKYIPSTKACLTSVNSYQTNKGKKSRTTLAIISNFLGIS